MFYISFSCLFQSNNLVDIKMSQINNTFSFFEEPNDFESLKEIESLINSVYRSLQKDFFGEHFKRVTLDELIEYSSPNSENNTFTKLIVGRTDENEFTAACVLFHWNDVDEFGGIKKLAGLHSYVVNPKFRKLGFSGEMYKFAKKEYKRLGIDLEKAFVISPSNGRDHGSKILLSGQKKAGRMPVKVDRLEPGKIGNYFDDYVEQSAFYKYVCKTLRESVDLYYFDIEPEYLKN